MVSTIKASDFIVTPTELHAGAICFALAMKNDGWKFEVEPNFLGYPRTPPLVGKRRRAQVFVEVQSRLRLAVLEEWVRFAKSLGVEAYVACIALDESSIQPKDLARLRALRVGLFSAGESLDEVLSMQDLSLELSLPEVSGRLKRDLAKAYRLFDEGHVSEGFLEAVRRLEVRARAYIVKRVETGSVSFASPSGRVLSHTAQELRQMTLGQLGTVYREVQSPNVTISKVGQGIKALNPDRIRATHGNATPAQMRALRNKSSQHMFVVVELMRLLSS